MNTYPEHTPTTEFMGMEKTWRSATNKALLFPGSQNTHYKLTSLIFVRGEGKRAFLSECTQQTPRMKSTGHFLYEYTGNLGKISWGSG
jgi:hypothetical protein